MKVLVTGSAGFAGSHFVEHIIANTDWQIVGLDSFRHKGDSLRVDGLLPKDQSHRYTVYSCDLSAPISNRLKDKIGHVDYIVNMASESHVDRSLTDPVPFVENNVSLVLSMLEYARRVKPKVFVQVSTDEVFGPAPIGYAHSEWDNHLPSNPYAASKSAQEAIAISYWRSFNVPVIITNTMNMVGERQDAEKFLPMLINKISRGEVVTIHGNKNNIGSRHYLHSRNHADAILWLIERVNPSSYLNADLIPDRFNIVGDREINNLELANMVARILDKPLKYELVDFHSARPGHDSRYALDGTKIDRLGWQAPVSLEDSIVKTINWTLENSEWM